MITLTVREIKDLAKFAGLVLNSTFPPDDDQLETEISITTEPAECTDDDGNEERSVDIKTKIELNRWDSIDDFLPVLELARAQKWFWWENPRCKYVELRVDMRDGGCVIRDREGKRIDPSELAFQYGEQPNAGGKPRE